MVAYVIADNKLIDPERYAAYSKVAAPTHASYGGKVLAAGGWTEKLDGDWSPNRIVVVEFPSVAMAKAWYDSPEYQQAKMIRDAAAEVRIIVVEGR